LLACPQWPVNSTPNGKKRVDKQHMPRSGILHLASITRTSRSICCQPTQLENCALDQERLVPGDRLTGIRHWMKRQTVVFGHLTPVDGWSITKAARWPRACQKGKLILLKRGLNVIYPWKDCRFQQLCRIEIDIFEATNCAAKPSD
jgi:hypothetical protein